MTTPGQVLHNLLVPESALQGYPFAQAQMPASQGLVRASIGWAEGRFQSVTDCAGLPVTDASGWTLLPRLMDCHVHLDKSYTIDRTGFSDGTVAGAGMMIASHAKDWARDDFRDRMTQAADCAQAHGTGAVRSHIDTPGRASDFPAWAAAQEVRAAFTGRMHIQIAALCALSRATDPEFGDHCHDVRAANGILGAFVPPQRVDPSLFTTFLEHATRNGLDVDFHIDETLDASAANIETLAKAILETGYSGRVLAGHCCTLSVMAPDVLDRSLDAIATSGMTIAALPRTNLYLQDRAGRTTPRQRGITPVHELRARGIPVALGTDNVEDAFYPFGDYDLLHTYRDAIPALHLDGDMSGWFRTITEAPARAMGLDAKAPIAPGQPANAILVKADTWPQILGSTAAERLPLGQIGALT